MPTIADALAFLAQQRERQSPLFAASQGQFVLSFLGTTNTSGVAPALSVHPLGEIAPVEASGCRVQLRGELGREPVRGDSITVSLTDWPKFRGYQLKTRASGGAGPIVTHAAPDRLELHASQVFTVHHSPNTVHMFENVPFDEVQATARVVRHAVVGVGSMVNISPRFVICYEVQDGALALFHGDGEANKTWMNLQQNEDAVHLVHDREDGNSFSFEGPCREIARGDFPKVFDELCKHYVRIGFGLPNRVYRQRVQRIAAA